MAEKILFISPAPLFPTYSGNRKRMLSVCSALMNMGYRVDFYYAGYERTLDECHRDFFNGSVLKFNAYNTESTLLSRLHVRAREIVNGIAIKWNRLIRVLKDGEESAAFNKGLPEYKNMKKIQLLLSQVKGSKYRAVIVNYAVYSFYFDHFNHSTIKILDTHDRLTDRFKMYLNEGRVPVDWHSLREEDEKKAICKADIVWAITDDEKDHYKSLIGDEKIDVKTVRHLIGFNRVEADNSGCKILIIGSDNQLNVDGLTWYLDSVWPEVRKSTGAELFIAGTLCRAEHIYQNTDGVKTYGTFGSEDEVYSIADICINPMQQGTGLKIKTLEALAHGKIVLSTTEGASGLTELRNCGLFISDDPAEWVKITRQLISKKIERNELIDKAETKINGLLRDNLNRIKESLQSH